jgi:hypothetical protein
VRCSVVHVDGGSRGAGPQARLSVGASWYIWRLALVNDAHPTPVVARSSRVPSVAQSCGVVLLGLGRLCRGPPCCWLRGGAGEKQEASHALPVSCPCVSGGRGEGAVRRLTEARVAWEGSNTRHGLVPQCRGAVEGSYPYCRCAGGGVSGRVSLRHVVAIVLL